MQTSTLSPPTAPRLRREPVRSDFLLFFVGIPVAMGILFSLVGIRLITGMPYLAGLAYMLIHMTVAWWSVTLGSYLIKYLFRSWRPPTVAICSLGYFVLMIPTAFLYQNLGDWYGSMYPSFAAARADEALASWNIDYLLHFVRYSIPALPLYLAAVFAYRALYGVNFFRYPNAVATEEATSGTHLATAQLIDGSKLSSDAVIVAIKAEQHYIQIWSDQGNDMVRYRFKDLDEALSECNGGKVHRSWWVNFDQITEVVKSNRKISLRMTADLEVPVSTSYKHVLDSVSID